MIKLSCNNDSLLKICLFHIGGDDMGILENKNINSFIDNYFKSMRIKHFFVLTIFLIFTTYLTTEKELLLFNVTSLIAMSFLGFFVMPDFLKKETEKEIEKVFKKTSNHNKDLIVICNLKKFNGPTFGTLLINEKIIEFKAFRENLQNESFLITQKEMKDIKISLYQSKISLLNKLFFKELNKSIKISYNNVNLLLQTPEPEKTIEEILKKVNLS